MTTPAYGTVLDIIQDGMKDAGLLRQGQQPSSDALMQNMRVLTDIILFEQTQGLKLWLNVDTPLTLIAGQSTYKFMPGGDVSITKPMRVIEGYNLDVNNVRRPLTVLSWDDYIRLSTVSQQGSVVSYFVNKQATEMDVFFWLTPDATAATGTAHVLLQTQVTNFTAVTDQMNFPNEWRIFLRWALADELSTGQPQAIMDRCKERAATYRNALEAWDVEDASTWFTPDNRVQYATSKFS